MSVYAYADESGNTGSNLFDSAQPNFYSAAVISDFDLDTHYKEPFDKFALSEGFVGLHAAEMGMGRLVKFLPTLEKWIKRDTIRFFVGRVVKRHLIVVKIFDTLFDPHENRAVSYHVYWCLPLRHIGVIKLNHIVTDEILRSFWGALMENDEGKSRKLFLESVLALRSRVHLVPDQRSREIFGDAFAWAESYPDEIGFHIGKRKDKLMHQPNLVAFPEMLRAIDDQAEFWKVPVKVIKHDRESQIQNLLKDWHQMLSNAGEGTFRLFQREIKIRVVSGSDFQISSSKDSAGIQLADIVLWLTKRAHEGGDIGEVARKFLARVERHSTPFELSMRASELNAAEGMAVVDASITSSGQLAKGRELLEKMEARRREGLKEFPLPA